MAVTEITTFRLAAGADEAAFLEADKRLQDGFANLQQGMIRRTTARGDGRIFAVLVLWGSAAAADAAAERGAADPLVTAFEGFVDASTRRVERYESLD
jgi:hypothetical protein